MNVTEQYFDIQQKLRHSDYNLQNLIERNAGLADLQAEKEHNDTLQLEFTSLDQKLSLQDESSDNIRFGFIQYTNEVLKAIIEIKNNINQFPDLNQGMILSGYLFSSILNDYRFILRVGEGYITPRIYIVQKEEWPVEDFQTLLIQIKNELIEIKFKSFKDAIIYYERIVDRIKTQLVILQQLGYV